MAGSQRGGWSGGAPAAPGPAQAFSALPLAGCHRRFAAGEALFLDDEPAESVYQVSEGVIRLSKMLPDGRRAILRFLYPGDLAGLSFGRHYALTAEAVTPAVVRSWRRRALDRAAEGSADLRHRLSAHLGRELEAAHARLVLLGRMSALERVADFLVWLARHQRSATRLSLPMTRLDIADYLGLTIETVSRTLSQLKRQGMIALPGPHEVVLLRPAALRALAGAGDEDQAPLPRAA